MIMPDPFLGAEMLDKHGLSILIRTTKCKFGEYIHKINLVSFGIIIKDSPNKKS